jgi:two-component system chemotaxis sensor kinase CheA
MSDPKDDFIIQLLATFRVEAAENIAALASGLLALERAGAAERPGIIERIFREAHSLKGAARAVNLADIESVCHALESLFADWKAERLTPSAAVFDLLHESLDFLSGLLSSGPTGRPRVDAMVRRLESAAHGRTSTGRMSTNPPQVPPREAETEGPAPVQVARATVRIQAAKLDSILRQTEDLLGPRLAGSQRVAELRATHASLVAWRKERDSAQQARNAIERALARGDSIDGGKRQTLYGSPELSKVLEHIEAEGTFLKDLETRVGNLEEAAEADRRALSGIVGNLLHDVKETLLLPFTSLFETLPRVVRDLARDQSKEVEVVTRGGEIEIDRRILEEMKAPLQHPQRRECGDRHLR